MIKYMLTIFKNTPENNIPNNIIKNIIYKDFSFSKYQYLVVVIQTRLTWVKNCERRKCDVSDGESLI